jgi:ADP-heptose:LPS heptosyltransferase/predicted SAM-dependent methyltransferase
MVWRADGPQGHESAKVRFDVVPYMNGRVLDLGCGPDKVFPTAIGIDNKIDAKLFGIQVHPDIPVDTCQRMPFLADHSADTVFSAHLLEHIVDYKAALAEWWRLVKVGGYLVLYLPHKEFYPNIGQPGANPDHKHDFVPEDIRIAMRDAAVNVGRGWDLIVDEDRNGGNEYSFLQVYRKRGDRTTAIVPPAPRPEKSLAVVRLGAFGDALWASSLFEHWKREGWHITLYTQPQGETALRHDPNLDRIICQPLGLFDFHDGKVSMWQTAWWLHEEKKYDRFVNLIGAVERRLLPQPFDPDFYLPMEQRHRVMNRNYIEALHDWAGVPFEAGVSRQKFYPTAAEVATAAARRAQWDGPLVVINPAGSSLPKWWPHAQELADRLAKEKVHSVIVGDLRHVPFHGSEYVHVVGTEWPIRDVFAFAAMADVVVGTESACVNAVAYEPPLKIVLMSHSTHENLTRDWTRTIAVEPDGLHCWPCHRIHADFTHCTLSPEANGAACQAAVKADNVLAVVLEHLGRLQKKAA